MKSYAIRKGDVPMFKKITLLVSLCCSVPVYAVHGSKKKSATKSDEEAGLLDNEMKETGRELSTSFDDHCTWGLGCIACELGSTSYCSNSECNLSYNLGVVAHSLSRCFQPVFLSCQSCWAECQDDCL